VVVVGVHRLHAQLRGQARDLLNGAAVAHQQPHAFGAVAAPERAQLLVEVDERLVDELDPPVRLQAALEQRLQDVGIEHKDAPDALALAQRLMQCSVVVAAQVAAQPDQTAGVGFGG